MIGTGAVAGPVRAAHGPSRALAHHARRPALGTVFVLNERPEGNESIVEFRPGQHGNAAPIATIAGSKTGLSESSDLAVTATGALVVPDPVANAIREYAPGAHGNVAPTRTIAGPKTQLDFPQTVAVGHDGAVWVADASSGSGTRALLEFAPGAHGNAAPIRVITGPKTKLVPNGIALTPNGKHLWVTRRDETLMGPEQPGLQEFSTHSSGNVAPVAVIDGGRTRVDSPVGIVIDAMGDLIVTDVLYAQTVTSTVLTFGPHAQGDAKPSRVLAGPKTGLDQPFYPVLAAKGDLWLPNNGNDAVERFAAGAHGDASPNRTLAGSATTLSGPSAVAVYTLPPRVPRALRAHRLSHRRIRLTWRAPAHTGGGLLGYRVSRKASKHGKWQLEATIKRRSLTTSRLAVGRYAYRVAAYNEAGVSRPNATRIIRVR